MEVGGGVAIVQILILALLFGEQFHVLGFLLMSDLNDAEDTHDLRHAQQDHQAKQLGDGGGQVVPTQLLEFQFLFLQIHCEGVLQLVLFMKFAQLPDSSFLGFLFLFSVAGFQAEGAACSQDEQLLLGEPGDHLYHHSDLDFAAICQFQCLLQVAVDGLLIEGFLQCLGVVEVQPLEQLPGVDAVLLHPFDHNFLQAERVDELLVAVGDGSRLLIINQKRLRLLLDAHSVDDVDFGR